MFAAIIFAIVYMYRIKNQSEKEVSIDPSLRPHYDVQPQPQYGNSYSSLRLKEPAAGGQGYVSGTMNNYDLFDQQQQQQPNAGYNLEVGSKKPNPSYFSSPNNPVGTEYTSL